MCVKEFLGYTCGHCSVPRLIRCPLAEQNDMFPFCKFPAERPVHVPEMCHPCSRVLWNRKVLKDEEAHKKAHQEGLCECEVVFDEEERLRRKREKGKRVKVGVAKGQNCRGEPGGFADKPTGCDPRHAEPACQYLGYQIGESSLVEPNVQLGFHPAHGSAHGMWRFEDGQHDSTVHLGITAASRLPDPKAASFVPPQPPQRDGLTQRAGWTFSMDQVGGETMPIVINDNHALLEALTIGIRETLSVPELENDPTCQTPITVCAEMLLESYGDLPPRPASAPPNYS